MAQDALYEKCVETPLATGGMIRGVLIVVFDHIKMDLFQQPGHQLQLKFKDVLGKQYSVEVGTRVGGSDPLAPTSFFNGLREEQVANTALTRHLTANLTATGVPRREYYVKRASIFSAASDLISGITWLYVSMVIPIWLCPSKSDTTFA